MERECKSERGEEIIEEAFRGWMFDFGGFLGKSDDWCRVYMFQKECGHEVASFLWHVLGLLSKLVLFFVFLQRVDRSCETSRRFP